MTRDDNTNKKKRKSKWTSSYSSMTHLQADERLGIRIESLVPGEMEVSELLASLGYKPKEDGLDADIMKTKEKVFDHITEYLDVAGYPTEAVPDFKEASIGHLVYATIAPILRDFIRRTKCESMKLRFEKEIVATDGATGGAEEFALVDLVSLTKEKFIFVVEVKRSSLGKGVRQCLLSMKDMLDNNDGDEVYGFVSTGTQWQMIRYDGTFRVTHPMQVLIPEMGKEMDLWMEHHSIVVDCMNVALSRGIMKNAEGEFFAELFAIAN